MKISISKENHLKAIFHLESDHGTVTTNELAAALHTRPASITDMLKKLQKEGLVLYERYKGFSLSQDGKMAAVQIIRNHRLWECFLVDHLDFDWSQVHEMAEELEHLTSRKLIDRLDFFLGFPRTDPHGDPIPDSDGKFTRQIAQIPLPNLLTGKEATVTAIRPQTDQILELLQHKKIKIGTRITIRKKFDFDDSLEIEVDGGASTTVSALVAKNIYVSVQK